MIVARFLIQIQILAYPFTSGHGVETARDSNFTAGDWPNFTLETAKVKSRIEPL